jgi:anti-sigma factor RsiW
MSTPDDLETRLKHMRDTHGGITCQEFDGFILDYVEGRLTPEQQGMFRGHIAACPGCERYLIQYMSTRDAVAATANDGPPPNAPPQLINAILAAIERGKS